MLRSRGRAIAQNFNYIIAIFLDLYAKHEKFLFYLHLFTLLLIWLSHIPPFFFAKLFQLQSWLCKEIHIYKVEGPI